MNALRPAFPGSPATAPPRSNPPRPLGRAREAIRLRTEDACVGWIRWFLFFHSAGHPAAIGAAAIEQFRTDTTEQRRKRGRTRVSWFLVPPYKEVKAQAARD
jgi:hypothetical protein